MTTRRLHFETFEPRKLLAADMMIPGDANHDGGFDSSDLITVFQTGEYEDDIEDNSVWEEGDWNGDGDFNSSDLVVAFKTGRYTEQQTLFPNVVSATLTRTGENTYRVSVALSSPYDTPDRYADAWRVLDPHCAELGTRILTHDHQFEQPFTRSLSNVVIPDGVTEVTIQGRDQISGWGGGTVTVRVPE